MKERGIIFTGESVRAILAGRKTQTRRVVTLPSGGEHDTDGWPLGRVTAAGGRPYSGGGLQHRRVLPCPYGEPGDRLWVRETFQLVPRSDRKIHGNTKRPLRPDEQEVIYAARILADSPKPRWRSPLHMPRWASRLTLEVVSVRVERVRDGLRWNIPDLRAEGVEDAPGDVCPEVNRASKLTDRFERAWDRINGKRPGCAWSDNPWVWVVEFRKVGA